MVFMDEFLFFDPRALPVILPTLANGAALVLTSSIAPNAADDLMRMLNVRYADGTPLRAILFKKNGVANALSRRRHARRQRAQLDRVVPHVQEAQQGRPLHARCAPPAALSKV
jgi:hypothetical protein